MMRIRITFQKTDTLRFIGHLDLHHLWIRTFRRAGVKVAYSQGFHPQPKIHLVSALSLGYTGRNELMECWLEDDLSLDEIQSKLEKHGHPGLLISHLEDVEAGLPALQTRLRSAHYLVQIPGHSVSEVQDGLENLFHSLEIWVERKKKQVNIRPFLLSFSLESFPDQGGCQLELHLSAGEGTTGRVDEILSLLHIDPLDCLVERSSVELS